MKRFITVLLVLSMVVCMFPSFAIATSAEEETTIKEGLNASFWLSVSEYEDGEVGHWDTWKRVMGWHGGYTTSFENNRKFDQAIGAMLTTSAKTGSKADVTEFAGAYGRNDYQAATGVKGDRWDNGYMVNWKGTMKATTPGTYTFIAHKVDNGCYIEIGGEKAFEFWGASYYFDGDNENVFSEQTFTITEAQVGQDIEFEMWFLEIDGGEALSMSVTDNGELSGKKSIADAGFTFDLDVDYYTCVASGDWDIADLEQYMTDGVKVDDNGNASSAAVAGNHTFSEEQLTNIKSEMMKVGTNVVKDMDNSAYQDNPVCEQFGMMYDCYMVEYEGYLTPSETANYLFGTHRVDNCFLLQLKIDGEWKTVYELWGKGIFNDRTTTYYDKYFNLEAGTSYELRAIFLEVGGGQPHQIIAKNVDTGAVYAELSSTMYLTTEAIPAADFTPKAASIALDGDLSDWEGTHTVGIEGSDEYAGKKATWYAVVTDEGVYMACDAYHDIYVTDQGEWHRNTNFEAWIKEPGHVQVWVSAGLNGRASDNVTAYNMTTTTLGDSTPKYHTVTELFISNAQLPGDSIKEGVFRAGVAWKTPGDICNNGAEAAVEWWCPKYTANNAKKHIVTADGIFTDTDFTFNVATPEELLAYIKMVNANSAIHNNFSNLLTLNITADIDMTGYEWTPLNRWIGIIDGNGHTISGLVVINEATGGNKGLLVNELSNWWDGRPVESGTIKNLTIKDSFIYAPNTEWNGVGAFAGISDRGCIENCTLEDTTVIGGDWTGGIVGRASGGAKDLGNQQKVTDCSVIDSTVIGYATPTTATKAVGAVVGTNDDAKLLMGNFTVKNTAIECSEGANRTLAIGAPDTAADRQPVYGDSCVDEGNTSGAIVNSQLTAGEDQTWDASNGGTVSFTVTGTDNSIKAITVGETVLKASDYTTEETSEGVTVITLKASLLKKLESGDYIVTVESYEGSVETTLTVVNEVAETGDMSFIIVLVSTLALGAVVVTAKKRRTV